MRKHQTAFLAAIESQNAHRGVSQDKIGARGGTVADAQPDHFGRAAEKETSLREIRVFADDGETIIQGVLPNLDVGGSAKAAIPEMDRTGVEIGEGRRQARR
jgi:hypothetical protein